MTSKNKKIIVLADDLLEKYLELEEESGPDTIYDPLPTMRTPPTRREGEDTPDTIPDTVPEGIPATMREPQTQRSPEDNLFTLVAKNSAVSKKIANYGNKLYDVFTLYEENAASLPKAKLAQLNKKLNHILAALQSLDI
jgi:hypothetical protein